MPATQQGTGGPSAGRSGSGSCPLVSRCERGSQPPPLLSSERSAGSDAAGELSHVGQWFFFFSLGFLSRLKTDFRVLGGLPPPPDVSLWVFAVFISLVLGK